MARVLVTGATGFIGSHLVRALLARGDDVRVAVRASSKHGPLEGLDVERVNADITDPKAMRRAARKGIERAFHVAGTTNLRKAAGGRPAHQRRGHAHGARRVPGREASSASSTCRRSRRSARRGRAERSTSATCTSARSASRTRTPSTPPRSRRCASPPAGSTSSSPARARARPRRRAPFLDRGRPSLPAAPHPRLRRRRDLHRRRRGRRGRADPVRGEGSRQASATSSAPATTRGSGCSASSSASRASRARPCGCRCARRSRLPRPPPALLARRRSRHPRSAPPRTGGRTARPRRARELGWTTRPHEDTVESTVRFHEERLGDRIARNGRRQPLSWRMVGRATRLLP